MFGMGFPGVYELKYDPYNKQYYTVYLSHKFDTPPKIYGDARFKIKHIWNNFYKNGLRGGILLTGQLGSGKTEIGKVLSNNAIDNGMYVIKINKIPFTPELISYLDMLDNVVLFFDEFGKNFNYNQQEQMLNLLSNTLGRKRIVIITENDRFSISRLIRNRPGRLRYSIHYNKLPISTMKEYCEDKGVDEKFYKDLLRLYKRLTVFSFDHLKAIVEEHLDNPDMPLKEIVELLNLEVGNDLILKATKVTYNGDDKEVVKIQTGGERELDRFEDGSALYIEILVKNKESKNNTSTQEESSMFSNNPPSGYTYPVELYVFNTDIVEMDEKRFIAKKGDYTIEGIIKRKELFGDS
jgi:hypothetical protein